MIRVACALTALALGCSGTPERPTNARQGGDVGIEACIQALDPPAGADLGDSSEGIPGAKVAARVFAFSDSQFHYLFGKRTFAQSPFAERMSFEVAVRPAALDDGSDLLLELFLDLYRARYSDRSLVFLGDAADLSCTHEMQSFLGALQAARIRELLPVSANHDGFYAGNFTSKRDADGDLRLTDMPDDWTRACARPGSKEDYRLTKGRAVDAWRTFLPPAPGWATEAIWADVGPTGYRDAYLYYARPLGGGDVGAPPVWGVFLDTVDYRGFDFESSRGAGSNGAVSRDQLRFLDRAMFEAGIQAKEQGMPITYVLFGHHPSHEFEGASRARLLKFLDDHPEIAAYVSAHTHKSMERRIELPSGRKVTELVVGSTTDSPQSARAIEVRVDLTSGQRSVRSQRLVLDTEALCAGVAPLQDDALGYTGYRQLRDSTPDLDIGAWDLLLVATGLSELAKERALQAVGALLMENELMRAWANLYRNAPIPLSEADRTELDAIIARRYAAFDTVIELRRSLHVARVPASELTAYDRWNDPVIADITAVAEHGVHRFAAHRDLIERLRALRVRDPEARRYFTCHAARAGDAEAKRPRIRGNVLYIR